MIESGRFLKKAAQKLLLPLGPVALKRHGPGRKKFSASFCSQKEAFS
jgi:hypothetical protein